MTDQVCQCEKPVSVNVGVRQGQRVYLCGECGRVITPKAVSR